jgi:putative spermidine/putrescine transport system ATP-binding protein
MTAIFVTHDQDEALAVSDRIAVMNAGRIEHFSEPGTLYSHPATAFALDFVGLSTRIEAIVTGQRGTLLQLDTPYGPIAASAADVGSGPVLVGVRPENIRWQPLGAPAREGCNRIEVTVSDVIRLGSRTHLHARGIGQDRLLCEQGGTAAMPTLADGERVALSWAVNDTLVYPMDSLP